MRTLATYIEYTLMTKHYVFVPGMGGFLLRDVDASFAHHTYTPSHKEVHFNRFMTKDDGMLADAYMTAEGLTYEEAYAKIQHESNLIISLLERHKDYVLGSLGTLTLDKDKHIVVKNPKTYPLHPDCYGLSDLDIRTWKEIESANTAVTPKAKVSNDADVVEIPKYWLQRAAAIVILAIVFLANYTLNQPKTTQLNDFASVVNSDVLLGNLAPYVDEVPSWDASWETEVALAEMEKKALENATADNSELENTEVSAEDNSVALDNNSAAADNISAASATSLASVSPTSENKQTSENKLISDNKPTNNQTIKESQTSSAKSVSASSSKLYYIIIGSCTSREEADRVILKYQKKGYDGIGILEKDDRFRLYLKSFTDRQSGEEYLQEVRETTPFQKAWLLPVRQESLLSINLKNKDNGKLSMELSYTDRRTERDQGGINT